MKSIVKSWGRRLTRWCIVAALIVQSLVLPAAADTSARPDPDGTTGRLDISEVSQAHSADGSVKHRISTFGPWRSRLLGRDATEFDLWIDLDADGSADRVVYFKSGVGNSRQR